MSDNYRLLLERVARLYERHEAGRRTPFNVFSVLRSPSDEVNLHSRFLHALLNYQKPGEETRENLKDFLEHVGIKDFEERPHGLSYSFTLHAPSGKRLIGFDNAHVVAATGSRYKTRPRTRDHWHRTESDSGRPYRFVNVETLLDDFFSEVERVLQERGVGTTVLAVEEKDS